uniref:proline-rich protein 11-like n=1 Tax=Oncorhynchus gorbuscha TaxID=8017 RepID=UPI001EAF1552|nr:proline-rich protein 11-like [Oncorhynchus gorbuscha]
MTGSLLGNCDPIAQTSPAQLEDPPVKNVKKWVPLLGVRLLLLAFGRIFQIWRNNLSQAVAPVWTLSLLSHHHHHLFLLHPTLSCNPTSLKKRVASNTQQEKQDILVAVTLRDLQAVKLRKVIVSSVKSKRTPEKMHAPLVTVADLQNVRLKQSHCQLPPKLLKLLSFGRSPDGTPLFDKENMETGTGLTPIMTQALRRKFQSTLPRGLSPKAKNLNESFDQN